jgi:hypothetical protein
MTDVLYENCPMMILWVETCSTTQNNKQMLIHYYSFNYFINSCVDSLITLLKIYIFEVTSTKIHFHSKFQNSALNGI